MQAPISLRDMQCEYAIPDHVREYEHGEIQVYVGESGHLQVRFESDSDSGFVDYSMNRLVWAVINTFKNDECKGNFVRDLRKMVNKLKHYEGISRSYEILRVELYCVCMIITMACEYGSDDVHMMLRHSINGTGGSKRARRFTTASIPGIHHWNERVQHMMKKCFVYTVREYVYDRAQKRMKHLESPFVYSLCDWNNETTLFEWDSHTKMYDWNSVMTLYD